MLTADASDAPAPVEALGPATVMWNDFVGSAAADTSTSAAGQELHDLAGLDPDRWLVLAVDIVLHGAAEHARVYALDRLAHGVSTQEELLDLAYRTGELTVDAFDLDAPAGATGSGRSLFDHIALRLVARGVSDQRLVIRAHP